MMNNCENGQNLLTIACEFGLSVSTADIVVKDADHIKDHMKGSDTVKSTILMKKHSGAIHEMQKHHFAHPTDGPRHESQIYGFKIFA
jgi:hypothetical protein